MTQADLKNTLFPVGGMTKPEVRAYLDDRGYLVASKAESQDICFVPDSAAAFVERQTKGGAREGKIVSNDGKAIGSHSGIHNFTVGQRRGLGIAHHNPLYVLNVDAESAEVTVGSKDELESAGFDLRSVNWISGQTPTEPFEAIVKARYRTKGIRCRVIPQASEAGEEGARIEFLEDWTSVSPGQAAVFYALEPETDRSVEILGGGIIDKRIELSRDEPAHAIKQSQLGG
ncbi:UNVERIFIED_CONTAM: hypothetical protein GTU68_026447 [Idotea baltica]|nr:hypothetical protein [Idotea baltica]